MMMRPMKFTTIPTMALVMAIPFLLSGCPKRADVADIGAQSAPAQAGAVSPSTGTSTSRPTGSAGEPSRSYSSTVTPKEEMVSPPTGVQEQPVKGAPSARPSGTAAGQTSPLKDIFFDFDKSNIRDDAKPNLSEDLQWLKANSSAQISIEGHCDERGTAEYNLGLGERRAKATRDYLVAAGIDGKRMKVISYGKERPFVLGHDEAAWRWNRRAHFVIDGQ